MQSFWHKIKKPILCMAPMADVTDASFRKLFAKYGRPDITWTEFVSADGLFLRPIEPGVGDKPKNKLEEIALTHGIGTDHPLLNDLVYSEGERPIVAQFFSKKPNLMYKAARLAKDLGYDGIDINMGCPAKVICAQGAGAAIIKTPTLAKEIIAATKEGAGNLPVSVKTRLGYNKNELETWLPNLLETNPIAVILHARTRKEMSKVPAKWDQIKYAVDIRNSINKDILILGNGDIKSKQEAIEKCKESGADGAMIGRGLFGNPWFFSNTANKDDLPPKEVLTVLKEHIHLYEKLILPHKPFAIMKKHFKAYIQNWDGAKELRIKTMEQNTPGEVISTIDNYLKSKDMI